MYYLNVINVINRAMNSLLNRICVRNLERFNHMIISERLLPINAYIYGRCMSSQTRTQTRNSMPSMRRDLTSLPKQTESVINISESCVERLRNVADINAQYLRIEVEGGGCSGFQYKFELTDQINTDDQVFEREGIKVVIDDTSLEYIKGSTIDYNEELIKSSFRVVNNPQSDHGCSCGASFSIKFDK